MMASRDGIGQLLQQYASTYQMDGVFAILIILAVVASLLNTGMNALERRLLRWQASRKPWLVSSPARLLAADATRHFPIPLGTSPKHPDPLGTSPGHHI
ncbi:hypothetical protein CA951_41250 [Rhodococcus sp. NCIMB 12038]|nr:hypothetical protein CA951_41250 [Rhodococcus sp. NCIMB 12038]